MKQNRQNVKSRPTKRILLTWVQAYDHYSTDKNSESKCVLEVCGKVVFEDDVYIHIQHLEADIDMSDSAKERTCVVKSAVINREDREVLL